ncbi:SPOR domain-containing protein [Glaciecola petra]|uniref:DamX-like protein n=1 Tax=Glaciecola petra TaxID=3075602 RepID=A0ABU2ZSC6_9ALTE|nr:DamX-like protein [Aestuariibacter sp. P117]MDT0595533.1 DamX-like protein [Aestuariibacter sp. P117]
MSELHDRLAHLVNYSSQLIFVSSEKLSDQHRTLNDFLAEQETNTEISFINADIDNDIIEYRAAICRQLTGQTVGSFIRPLPLLLEEYDSNGAAVLVCITQAECLPQSFLQELWDWVSEAQSANRPTHINVILFAESNWAESAQEWLPKQNSHKPILLSSQNVDATGFDVHALEALMAEDKSWFAVANRPIVSNKWFIGSVLGLFFVIFIGLIAWQYPEEISDVIAGDFSNPEDVAVFDIEEADLALDIVANEAVVLKKPTVKEEDSNKINTYASNLELVDSEADDSQLSAIASPLTNTFTEDNVSKPSSGDFKVPDIISVDQLAANFESELTTESNKDETILIANGKNITDSEIAIDYQFDETTLLSLPSDAIVLQLSGIQNPSVLEDFLNDNSLRNSTWVYQTERYGGAWYVVLYKDSFASIESALNKLTSLPEEIRQAQPFAKSVNQIQLEIKQR